MTITSTLSGLCGCGEQLLAEKQFAAAAMCFSRAVELAPDTAAAHWGLLLARRQCTEESELYARLAVPIDGDEEYRAALRYADAAQRERWCLIAEAAARINAATERIRRDRAIERGEITPEEAFVQDLEMKKGAMVTVICPVCGRKTALHEKMPDGYCSSCGEKITLQAAQNGELQDTAIAYVDGSVLYAIAVKRSPVDMKLMEAAADKGVTAAARAVAGQELSRDAQKALRYAQIGEKTGDPDCRLYVIAAQLLLKAIPDDRLSDAFTQMVQLKKSGFHTEEADDIYDTIEELLHAKIENHRRKAAVQPSYAGGSSSGASSGSGSQTWAEKDRYIGENFRYGYSSGAAEKIRNDSSLTETQKTEMIDHLYRYGD